MTRDREASKLAPVARPPGPGHRRIILDAAASLFREKGVEATSFREIVDRSGLPRASVLKHFPSVQTAAAGYIEDHRRNKVVLYAEVLRGGEDDPVELLARLVQADIGDVSSSDDRLLWRELLAAEYRAPEGLKADSRAQRKIYHDFLSSCVLRLQQAGKISAAVPTSVASDILYALTLYQIDRYCADETLTTHDVYESTKAQVRCLLDGWRAA